MFTRPPLPPFPNAELLGIRQLWTELQTLLNSDAVLRWQSYSGLNGGIRDQNLLQHSYSIAMLGSYVVEKLRPFYPNLDLGFILKALLIHDIGEALLKRDVPYTEKSPMDDVDEYVAVKKALGGLPAELRAMYLEAFLLQFCLDTDKYRLFDEDAQETMRLLAATKQWESRVFSLIEHVDYLMFMVETYKAGNDYLLYHVLESTELGAWEGFRETIPRVEELVLGVETIAWFKEFMANYVANGGDMVPTHKKKK
jgi:5'-deoxynucleotidase YfbR-like HD superfamily hydrolase